MDDKKRKKPSSKKDPKSRGPKKVDKQLPEDKSEPEAPISVSMAALSAVLMASADHNRKEGEGIKFISEHMQEYLSNYILIGYTMEGNPVHITYAPSPKDYDSLNTGLHRYILEQGPLG